MISRNKIHKIKTQMKLLAQHFDLELLKKKKLSNKSLISAAAKSLILKKRSLVSLMKKLVTMRIIFNININFIMQANEFEQTYMAFKTVLEMVEDRNYFIPQNLQQISELDFQEKYQ